MRWAVTRLSFPRQGKVHSLVASPVDVKTTIAEAHLFLVIITGTCLVGLRGIGQPSRVGRLHLGRNVLLVVRVQAGRAVLVGFCKSARRLQMNWIWCPASARGPETRHLYRGRHTDRGAAGVRSCKGLDCNQARMQLEMACCCGCLPGRVDADCDDF